MFKDEYRKSMSFPVSEELLARTAKSMRQKRKAPPRRLPIPQLAACAAAVFLLVLGVTGGLTHSNDNLVSGGEDSAAAQEFAMDGAAAGGAISAEPEAGQADGAKPEADDTAPQLYSAMPSQARSAAPTNLTGVEKETVLLVRSPEEAGNSGNPWSEADTPEALPVYRNPAGQLSDGELSARAVSIVTALGGSADAPAEADMENGVASVTLENVTVTGTGEAIVAFDPPKTVQAATAEEAAVSFYETYAPLIGLEEPAFSITTRYTEEEEPTWSVAAYESSGVAADQILAFNLTPATFEITSEGDSYRLNALRLRTSLPEEAAGEYPLIPSNEAREQLLSGAFQTGAAVSRPIEADAIQDVELVYWRDSAAELWQPVYRFLVELPEEGRLQAYAACYVPACEIL